MQLGIGLKCPHGHMRVQMVIGAAVCSVCGAALVADAAAAPTALNRHCRHCGTFIGVNLCDTPLCPQCQQPWD